MINLLSPFRTTNDPASGDPQSDNAQSDFLPEGRGKIIAIANEKGGCGKSTMAMHLAVALLKKGYAVSTLDLDIRQNSLTRYIANRRHYADAIKAKSANEAPEDGPVQIPIPEHFEGGAVTDAGDDDEVGKIADKNDRGLERLRYIIDGSRANMDFMIIDTPGSDTEPGRLAHQLADLILTPVNDSFVDLDVIAQIDARKKAIIGPSPFATLLLTDRQTRQDKGRPVAPWLVARNRIGALKSHNSRDVDWALELLQRSVGLQVVPGFSERVIFRELFLIGLTILDLKDASGGQPLSRSHIAAREEVYALADAVAAQLPKRAGVPT